MVQNVSNSNNTQKGGIDLFSGIKTTVATAIPGAAIGGAVGGVMSLLPPGKSAIKNEMADLFISEAKGDLKSKKLINLLNRPEINEIKAKIKNSQVEEALDDVFVKLPKNDELLVLAKKAAKSKKSLSLLKSGVLFGVVCVLLVNLIQSRKKDK